MSALAEDDEIRALFEVEALDRLTRLADLLLQLEAQGGGADIVASLFREAHTLKGSADMVGFHHIAGEADAVETVLAELRDGRRSIDPLVIDELFAGLDRLSELSGIPVAAGARSGAGPGADEPATPVGVGPEHEAALEAEAETETVAETAAETESEPAAGRARMETARVAVDRLDDLVRLAGESAAAHQRVLALVADLLGSDPHDVPAIRALSRHLTELQDRTLRARMRSIGDLAPALRRTARDVARRTGKEVHFVVQGEGTEVDRDVHERLAEALVHLVRNAVDHGLEDPAARLAAEKPEVGTVTVRAVQLGTQVEVTVRDDGRGVHLPSLRRRADAMGLSLEALDEDGQLEVLFHPGFSTAAAGGVSGRGVGLDAVRESIESVRGQVSVSSVDGEGTCFRLLVPTTLTVLQSLVLVAGGTRCAVALHDVRCVLSAETGELPVDGRAAVRVDQEIVPMGILAPVLGRAAKPGGPIVVLRSGGRSRAVRVDAVLGQRDLLVKALPALVPRSDLVVGSALEPDGSVLLLLDVDTVIRRDAGVVATAPTTTRRADPGIEPDGPATAVPARRGRVLVVDDALTVRELQRSILERAGFDVRTASDGGDALARLGEAPADLVLSDIEMAGMDGLGLTRAIRDDARWRNLPVVLLTSRGTDDDRRRGMEAGADAYIVKSSFDEAALLELVDDLLGRSA